MVQIRINQWHMEITTTIKHEVLDAPYARRHIGLSAKGCRELGKIDGAQYDDGLYHL